MTRRAPARVTFLSVMAAMAGALVFCARADAQITVTNATFPAAGDTLRLAHDNAPGPCVFITPPGGPQTWDFSCLVSEATQDIVYRPASEGSVVVPGAEMFAVTSPYVPQWPASAVEEYYDVTSTGIRVQATYGKVGYVVADSVVNLNPLFQVRSAPMNFFDIRQSSSGKLAAFDDTEFSPAFLASMPFTADSLRYRVAVNELFVVDAFGTLSIPGGTYDVLREKRTRYTETRLDAKINPLGWLDVTDIAIQFAGHPDLGVDTLVHYSFYSNVAKEPIAVVATDNSQLRPVRVTFKRSDPVCQNDGDPCGDPSSSACDLPDTCLAGVCVPNYVAAGAACGSSSDTACTNPDSCDGAGACVPNDEPNGTACSDGNACTTGDTCQDGTCAAGPPPDCSDGDACTIDSCSPATGCVHQPDPVCVPPISVLSAVLQVESCAPANGALDPSERVTYAVTLRNNGSQATSSLVATLLPSASVSSPSGAQSYGAIPAGGSATRAFTWTGLGACGATWSAALALADGTQSLPSVNVTGTYGTPGPVCTAGCAVVRIATKTALSRNADGSVRAVVTLSNTGSVQADNVVLTSALLGTSSGTPLPQAAANIAPGQSQTLTVTFPSSVLAGGSVLRLGGTYAGGTFTSSLRVAVP